jgi:NTE family protein
MKRIWSAAIALIFAFANAGCGTRAVDYPLVDAQRNQDRRAVAASADHPFVVLAFSGGGSRAAALAAGVTARLDRVTYPTPSGPRRLSQDIAVVSSVSGGSVYATYLAINGPSAAQAEAFQKKIQNFDGIGYLAGKALNPLTWINLQLENKTRIDVLQEMLTDLLGTNATLATLNRPNQPIFLLNASDLVSGEVFTFDPPTLDDLCMNYDQTPLTLATTASAAFPIAFTPVLLQNHSYVDMAGCPNRQIAPGDWRTQLKDPRGPYGNLESFRLARYRDSLRGGRYFNSGMNDPRPFRRPQYVRLVDGGVVDNLGLTAIRRALSTTGSPADLTPIIAQRRLKQLVVIVVNARSDAVSPLNTSPEYITIPTFASSVAGTLVDSASAGSASTFRGFILNLLSDRQRLLKDRIAGAEFEVYPIDIDFDQLPNSTTQEQTRLDAVKSIGTSWTLNPPDVPLLDSVAGELLWRHPCFIKLVADLQAQATPDPNAHPIQGLDCPWPTVAESR